MFCPICKAEYRPEFTECSDCHIALVAESPQEGSPEAYAVLWRGENGIFEDQLVEALDEAGIVCSAIPLDILFKGSRDVFNISREPLFGSAVCVTVGDLPAAKKIAEKLLGTEPGEDQPGLEVSPEKPVASTAKLVPPRKWNPADATVEVWSGTEERTKNFVADALREAGISARLDAHGGGLDALVVRPEDEERAKEIVREVVEATPPE